MRTDRGSEPESGQQLYVRYTVGRGPHLKERLAAGRANDEVETRVEIGIAEVESTRRRRRGVAVRRGRSWRRVGCGFRREAAMAEREIRPTADVGAPGVPGARDRVEEVEVESEFRRHFAEREIEPGSEPDIRRENGPEAAERADDDQLRIECNAALDANIPFPDDVGDGVLNPLSRRLVVVCDNTRSGH